MYGNYIATFGGFARGKAYDNIYVYSLFSNEWKQLSIKLPLKMFFVEACLVNECIYVIGGYDGSEAVLFFRTYNVMDIFPV